MFETTGLMKRKGTKPASDLILIETSWKYNSREPCQENQPESTPEPQGPGAEFLTGCRLSCNTLGVMHTSFLNGTQPESTPEPQGLELSQADGLLSSLVFKKKKNWNQA